VSRIRFILVVALFVIIPNSSWSAVIFSDNFDSQPTNCYVGGTEPTGWAWRRQDAYSATFGGVTHYAGEISSVGRNGSGKSLKMWRHSTFVEGYCGSLDKTFTGTYHDIYIRYYMKIPTTMDFTAYCDYLKLWRFNFGSAEQYFGIRGNRANAWIDLYNSSSGHVEVMNHTQTLTLWDGNWHCVEVHINNTANPGTAQVWLDGVATYSSTSHAFEGTGALTYLQHFSMGNHASGVNWQSSWQAMEIDDFVLSTTYVGPDATATMQGCSLSGGGGVR